MMSSGTEEEVAMELGEGIPATEWCPFTMTLSDEVLLLIIRHLDVVDVMNLSQTCVKFSNLLRDRQICGDLRVRWNFKIRRLDLVKFLRDRLRASLITKLNMNDVYWVPSGVLRNTCRPMVNLEELRVAGTLLTWPHMQEVVSGLERLTSLSWSWDHSIDGSCNRIGERAKSLESFTERSHNLELMKPCLARLRSLLIHVPGVSDATSATFAAPAGISHFISACQNLEHLWILSWPKTMAERKMIEIFADQSFPSELKLPKLRTFSVRVMGFPRIHLPKLINAVLGRIGENLELSPEQLSHLWLDHLYLSGSPWNSLVNNVRGRNAAVLNPWPRLRLNHVETLSIPLMDGALQWFDGNTFDKVKNLQITDGLPRVVNLSNVFDRATELRSIVIKAFNIKLEWNRFVEIHPKLQLVNACEDGYFPYPDICVALAKLEDLRKLSLPLYSLLEIRDSSILSSYRAAVAMDSEDEFTPKKSSSWSTSMDKYGDTLFGKKSRVAHKKTVAMDRDSAVSGLDLITHSCRRIEEFELGFSTKARPGFMIVKSLQSICKWKNLRRLTLDEVPVQDGVFLIKIAKACRLEFLSLRFLGPRAKCNYMDDLCPALTFMTHLRDFRFEQNYIGANIRLFRSLQSCRNLQRFLLWSKSNDQPLDAKSCLDMVEACQDLTMLYITVGATTKSCCETLRKTIETKYKSSRPGLCIAIRKGSDSDDDSAPPTYPSIHYREMVVFAPQIGQVIDFDVI